MPDLLIFLLTLFPVAAVAFIAGHICADRDAANYLRRYCFCVTCERFEEDHA